MMTSRITTGAVTACLLTAAALAIAGCSSTYQTRGAAKPSPFLGDTSQLRAGKSGEAKLVYLNPKADFRKYTKIQLDPIVLVAENAKANVFAKMSKADQQAVVNYFDAQVRARLAKDYTFVTSPGADVMRLRVAVTEARGSTVVLDTLSSVIPAGVAVSAVKRVATGTHSAVGRAGVEMELQDSVSGERLAAAVDERAGRKITLRFDKFRRYHTVESAADFWAERLQQRLAEFRAAKASK
jgi:hypothetical protein